LRSTPDETLDIFPTETPAAVHLNGVDFTVSDIAEKPYAAYSRRRFSGDFKVISSGSSAPAAKDSETAVRSIQ
jgi:hypothetical protein